MGNNTASTLAFEAFVPAGFVIADLVVMERAVAPKGDFRGQVCPATGGGTDFGAQTWPTGNQSVNSLKARELSARIRVARYGSAIRTLTVMDSVQLSKPRTGYHATSGTG